MKPQKSNREGDIVLIHYQDQPSVYARIEWIQPDVKRDWFRVTLLFLTVPAQTVTWILREEYINGETFTMGGHPMRLEGIPRVPEPGGGEKNGSEGLPEEVPSAPAKVILLNRTNRKAPF